MFLESITQVAATEKSKIQNSPSRCLRMLYSGSSCSSCVKVCEKEAIFVEPVLSFDENKCSSCMLCSSVCPTEAIESKSQKNIQNIIKSLNKHERPVLACKYADKAHEKTECLGWLSKEYVLAFCFNLENPVQINLSQCDQCENGYIINSLTSCFEDLHRQFGDLINDKIKIVRNADDLSFEPLVHSRREFFKAFSRKDDSENPVFSLEILDSDRSAYADKAIPIRRQLLTNSIEKCSSEIKNIIIKDYFHDLQIDRKCDLCQECDAVCPTGALAFEEEESIEKLVFQSDKCISCELCKDICDEKLVTILPYNAEEPPSTKTTLIRINELSGQVI